MADAEYRIRICNLAMLISSNLNDNQVIAAKDLAKTALWIYQQPQTICVRDLVLLLIRSLDMAKLAQLILIL